MTNWKVIAVFAGVGVFLSLLFGVFTGNPFGVVFFRVLLSGAAAAGMGFVLLFVVGRFLPEVGGGSSRAEAMGEHIDIVLPGENPHDSSGEQAEDSVADSALAADTGSEASDVEEVDGLEPEQGSAEPEPGDAEDEAVEPQEIGTAGGLEPEGEAESAGIGGPEGDRVDSLGGRAGSVKAGGQEQDPEVVARAVRTMMKRDEEG